MNLARDEGPDWLPLQFYEALAENDHLLFSNWRQSLRGQGEVLTRVIEKQLRSGLLKMLDCACGIRTQAIGLAPETAGPPFFRGWLDGCPMATSGYNRLLSTHTYGKKNGVFEVLNGQGCS